ncbi:MAG: OmpA family protein [Saprospiraceae bacterium]|nr:OmpA family protein [Saprospiraceae bacterium]
MHAVQEKPSPTTVPEEETPEIQPVASDNSVAENAAQPSGASKSASSDHMDQVQVVEVKDKMVIYYPYKSTQKEENAIIDGHLESLAQKLKQSGAKVTITGHTDFVGEPDENYRFGLLRANGIKDILIKKGVASTQIKCTSMGDKKPAATNDTPYGRYLNRRVEILLIQ